MERLAPRIAFRHKCNDLARQKQLRNRYTTEGTPPVPHLDLKRAVVRRVIRRLAEQIIHKYEWLGTLPPLTNYYYGTFFGDYSAGMTCTALGASSANANAHKDLRYVDSGHTMQQRH